MTEVSSGRKGPSAARGLSFSYLDRKRCLQPYRETDAARPNVFVFTVDMIPPEFHQAGAGYRALLERPAWDALEADSVCFRNAFSVSPLCGPSRASMFTGRYPYIQVNEERAHDGCEVELRPDDPIYPQYLKARGYLAGHVGKSHVGTHAFIQAFGESCSPWNRWAPPLYDDPEYHQYLRARGICGFRYNRRITGLRPDRRSPGNFYGGWVEQENGEPFPMAGTYPHYLVDRALALLESMRSRASGGAPLYLHLDLFAPHQPFVIPAGLEAREAELRRSVDVPSSWERWAAAGYSPAGPEPRIYETYRRNWGLYDRETVRDYVIANMLQVEVIDRALATFVARLRELDLYDESVILFTADHGEMNGEQGLVDKGVYGHPKAARIPLLLKLPSQADAGRCVDSQVCLLDVAPTFFELAGVAPAARLDGESLLARLRPGDTGRAEPFLFEAGWHVAPNPAVALHGHCEGHDYRYVYNCCSDTDELYDLSDQTYRNRIQDPAQAPVRRELRRRLQTIFESDARWRCYRQAFLLDRAEDLPDQAGDLQMFVPEA